MLSTVPTLLMLPLPFLLCFPLSTVPSCTLSDTHFFILLPTENSSLRGVTPGRLMMAAPHAHMNFHRLGGSSSLALDIILTSNPRALCRLRGSGASLGCFILEVEAMRVEEARRRVQWSSVPFVFLGEIVAPRTWTWSSCAVGSWRIACGLCHTVFSVPIPGLLWHGMASARTEIQEWPLFSTCR